MGKNKIILDSNIFIVNNDALTEIQFFKKFKKTKISFTDISLLYLAEKYQALLFSFDKQLIKIYRKAK